MLNHHHIRHLVAGCGLALVLLGSSGGAAAAQPLDPVDTHAAVATPHQDLRSPDARDAAAASPWEGLRPPDVRSGFYRPIAATPAEPAAPTGGTTVDWPMVLVTTGGYLLAVVVSACAFAALRSGRRRRVAA
jgi:hypothetical protein